MAEYIDREVCIEAYCNFMCQRHRNKCGFTTFCDGRGLIENTPAADVAPVVHGRWELYGNDDDLSASFFCSLCGWNIDEDEYLDRCSHFNYCPNCGAKMDGEI